MFCIEEGTLRLALTLAKDTGKGTRPAHKKTGFGSDIHQKEPSAEHAPNQNLARNRPKPEASPSYFLKIHFLDDTCSQSSVHNYQNILTSDLKYAVQWSGGTTEKPGHKYSIQ